MSNQSAASTDSTDLQTALESLRDGVETRDEQNSVIHTLLGLANEQDIPAEPLGHPKVTQSIFRYEHDAELVCGEIRRAIETYDLDGEVTDIVSVLQQAADTNEARA